MRTHTSLALLLGGLFGCAVMGWATMNPQYSSYVTYSADATHIYVTALVDGTTTGCNLPPYCINVYHQGKVYVTLAGTGGWVYGSQVPPSSYLSVSNAQSISATSTFVQVQTQGEVICSEIGAIFLTAVSISYSATNPNCGGNNGEVITVYEGSQTPSCNGTTTYRATATVAGSGAPHMTSINVSTTTDNTLLIDLLGGPTNDPLCTNSFGSHSWCFDQNYKTAVPNQYTGTTGNINWSWSIYCGFKQNPDIHGTVPQPITCQ